MLGEWASLPGKIRISRGLKLRIIKAFGRGGKSTHEWWLAEKFSNHPTLLKNYSNYNWISLPPYLYTASLSRYRGNVYSM